MGGRGANITKISTKFNNISVGDRFQQTINGTTYNIEVTRKNKNDYTVQAMSVTENGKEVQLFGPNWITTLVEKRNKETPRGYISLSETKRWRRNK